MWSTPPSTPLAGAPNPPIIPRTAPLPSRSIAAEITYHGPGQLVGYPIVGLPDGVGVVDYVRRLEGAIIELLAGYGLQTQRVEGRTGVWLPADDTQPERKICAIGVRVSQRTTMHGFALNVLSSAERFGNIVPCGISDAGVTSIIEERGGSWSVEGVAQDLEPILRRHLVWSETTPQER